jgi:dienelactone hydrolase
MTVLRVSTAAIERCGVKFPSTARLAEEQPFRRLHWKMPVAVAAACLLMFAGCTSTHKPEVTLRQLVDRGYAPKPRYAISVRHETWRRGETSLDTSFIAPTGGGPFPLIIYLPGLGESASAGILWRTSWAEAGYAVLAVQPENFGEVVWTSPQAREGKFQEIARGRFSSASLRARLEFLDYSLAEIRRRASTGLMPYAVADTTRVAVAGFDLGAQTASVVAGEKDDGVNVRMAHENIRAVVILSPYADSAMGRTPPHFAATTLPSLSITGTDDGDPYDLISTPSLRQVPWQSMPPGGKYLLLLKGGTHALLAGAGLYPPGELNSGGGQPKTGVNGHTGHHRGGGPIDDPTGRQIQFGESGDQATRGPDSSGNRDSNRRWKRPRGNLPPATFDLQEIAAVQDVSTAFLDSMVKSSPDAQSWLARDATAWLGHSAVLKVK